jgi:hypothetical protein
MATLLPSLSSDDEHGNWTEDDEKDATDTGEVNEEFVFGGILVRFKYVYFQFRFGFSQRKSYFVDRLLCFFFSHWAVCGFSRAKMQEVKVIFSRKRVKRDGPIKRHCEA